MIQVVIDMSINAETSNKPTKSNLTELKISFNQILLII